MIEVFWIMGQFIADNATLFGFTFSLGCAAGTWHLCKRRGDEKE